MLVAKEGHTPAGPVRRVAWFIASGGLFLFFPLFGFSQFFGSAVPVRSLRFHRTDASSRVLVIVRLLEFVYVS